MKKIIIVAPISESLINFRGDLIKDMKNKGCNVITVSPALSEEHSNIFKQRKIVNIPVNFQRNKYTNQLIRLHYYYSFLPFQNLSPKKFLYLKYQNDF